MYMPSEKRQNLQNLHPVIWFTVNQDYKTLSQSPTNDVLMQQEP